MTNNRTLRDDKILDLVIFDDLQSVMEDGFHELLREFIRDTPPVLNDLFHAISSEDFEHIFSIAHSQEGSTGNLGISRLSSLLKQIQQMAKSENIEQCKQFGKEIEIAFEEAKEVLLKKMNEE